MNVQGNVATGNQNRNDQWRFKWHNNRWWYWTPDNSCVVYHDNKWHPYTPGMFSATNYGSTGYYAQPYSSGYSYSSPSYNYYGNRGYGYGPSIGLNFGSPRYYSGFRGYGYPYGGYGGAYGNRGGVSIGRGGVSFGFRF